MKCPICKTPVTEPATDQPRGVFPFCSERCKLIDLGRWLGGKYQIPVEPEQQAPPATDDEPTSDPPRRR